MLLYACIDPGYHQQQEDVHWSQTHRLFAGRGGSCELMLGCIAKAEVSSLDVDQSEMDVVQWVSRQGARIGGELAPRVSRPFDASTTTRATILKLPLPRRCPNSAAKGHDCGPGSAARGHGGDTLLRAATLCHRPPPSEDLGDKGWTMV